MGTGGKTRLALEVAVRSVDRFPDGVWFADLSSLTDAALVPAVVLNALGGREAPGQTPLESVARQVRGLRLLLVLDNCEHLVDARAELVGRALSASSDLRVLATSREALGVAGEIAWRVPSLGTPFPFPFPGPPTRGA
jgi:predicted ATPase